MNAAPHMCAADISIQCSGVGGRSSQNDASGVIGVNGISKGGTGAGDGLRLLASPHRRRGSPIVPILDAGHVNLPCCICSCRLMGVRFGGASMKVLCTLYGVDMGSNSVVMHKGELRVSAACPTLEVWLIDGLPGDVLREDPCLPCASGWQSWCSARPSLHSLAFTLLFLRSNINAIVHLPMSTCSVLLFSPAKTA